MNKTMTEEVARSLIGKDVYTKVKYEPNDAKRLGREFSEQSGIVLQIEKDKDGYIWLIYDWGWGVRIDAIVEWE